VAEHPVPACGAAGASPTRSQCTQQPARGTFTPTSFDNANLFPAVRQELGFPLQLHMVETKASACEPNLETAADAVFGFLPKTGLQPPQPRCPSRLLDGFYTVALPAMERGRALVLRGDEGWESCIPLPAPLRARAPPLSSMQP